MKRKNVKKMKPSDLGRPMEILCSCYPPYMMENIVFSAQPLFATYGTGVRFMESSNEVNACTQQCNVVGPFGSGKGGVAHLYEWLMAPLLAQNAASMDAEFDAWVESQKSQQGSKKGEGGTGKVVHEKGKAPRIVGPNISYLQLLLRMKEAKGEHLLMFTEEIVELVNNSQLSYGKLGPVLTHAFDRDGGVCTNQSASSSSPNLSVKALLNTLLIGQDEYFMKFFKDWRTGKFSRQLVTFTQSRLGEKKPRYLRPGEAEMKEIRTCLERLQQEDNKGRPMHVPEIEECIDSWYDEMNSDYKAGLIDDARLQLTYRCGIMGKRAAYLMYVMCGKVMSPCILNMARYVAENNLDNLYSLAAHEMNQKSEIRELMKRNVSLFEERTRKLLDKLRECGEVFDAAQFDAVSSELGICGESNARTVARSRLVKKQLIRKVDAHHWKVN